MAFQFDWWVHGMLKLNVARASRFSILRVDRFACMGTLLVSSSATNASGSPEKIGSSHVGLWKRRSSFNRRRHGPRRLRGGVSMFRTVLIAAAMFVAGAAVAEAEPVGNRVELNGMQMYYEVSGEAIR
jgi:hypothetical protein